MDLAEAVELSRHLGSPENAKLVEAETLLAQALDQHGDVDAHFAYSALRDELDRRDKAVGKRIVERRSKVERLRSELAEAEAKGVRQRTIGRLRRELSFAEDDFKSDEENLAIFSRRAPKPRRRKFYSDGSSSLL